MWVCLWARWGQMVHACTGETCRLPLYAGDHSGTAKLLYHRHAPEGRGQWQVTANVRTSPPIGSAVAAVYVTVNVVPLLDVSTSPTTPSTREVPMRFAVHCVRDAWVKEKLHVWPEAGRVQVSPEFGEKGNTACAVTKAFTPCVRNSPSTHRAPQNPLPTPWLSMVSAALWVLSRSRENPPTLPPPQNMDESLCRPTITAPVVGDEDTKPSVFVTEVTPPPAAVAYDGARLAPLAVSTCPVVPAWMSEYRQTLSTAAIETMSPLWACVTPPPPYWQVGVVAAMAVRGAHAALRERVKVRAAAAYFIPLSYHAPETPGYWAGHRSTTYDKCRLALTFRSSGSYPTLRGTTSTPCALPRSPCRPPTHRVSPWRPSARWTPPGTSD